MKMLAVVLGCLLCLGASADQDQVFYQIVQAENDRDSAHAVLRDHLLDVRLPVAMRVGVALGRIGDDAARVLLEVQTKDARELLRYTSVLGLGMIHTQESAGVLADLIKTEANEKVLARAVRSWGETGFAKPEALFSLLSGKPRVAEAAAQAIGMHETWGVSSAYKPTIAQLRALAGLLHQEHGATEAAFAFSRLKGRAVGVLGELIAALKGNQSGAAAALLIRALGYHENQSVKKVLLAVVRSKKAPVAVLVEGARALGRQRMDRHVEKALIGLSKHANRQVVVAAIGSMGEVEKPSKGIKRRLVKAALYAPSTWVRSEALLAGSKHRLGSLFPVARVAVHAKEFVLMRAGYLAAARYGLSASVTKLLVRGLGGSDQLNRTAASEALAEIPDPQDFPAELNEAILVALAARDLAASSYISAVVKERGLIDFTDALVAAYGTFTKPEDVEAKVSILETVSSFARAKDLDFFKAALGDPVRQVAMAAALALVKMTGDDRYKDDVITHTAAHRATPARGDLMDGIQKTVSLYTNRGEVRILTFGMIAPLTTENFLRLAREGFYEGLKFHRVVSNFVVQGGDPRGDGYGGPSYIIREEIGPLSHQRGLVGMATAGKDTAGSQFFINHGPNLHLDGHYTIFGRVVAGMDVVDRIEAGDVITGVLIH